MADLPRILVVSYNFPRPDKSSGELRFVAILEILRQFWEIDLCVANSHVDWNTGPEFDPYIAMLEEMGIRVLRPTRDTFSNAVRDNHYAGGYFNLFRIAEEMMPLFKIAQPHAFTIVDSVDVHFAREETQARMGAVEMAEVLKTKARELGVYRAADVAIAVSRDDYTLLTEKEGLRNVFLIPNIVREFPRAPGPRKPVVIFVGSYAWYPNPEAVLWFSELIWPAIREEMPEAEFMVIGSDATPEILALDRIPGINVLGYVPETRPYLEMAAVSVAPLRVGGGMKGKVNEALAHGIPVVATSIGAQGFDYSHGVNMMVSDDPSEFASSVITLLRNPELQESMGLAGQELNSAICSRRAVTIKLQEMVVYCERLTRKQGGMPFRHLIVSARGKAGFLLKDMGHAWNLLKREGPGEFVRRTAMYLKGQRLPEVPRPEPAPDIRPWKLIIPEGVLDFPVSSARPAASIIIPVYNQWEYTHACLGAILENTKGIDYEIILVDDVSTDETTRVGEYARNIRVIRNESNQGFLLNCNMAVREARGEYIVLLNNDTMVQPGWLEWFLRTMREKPDVGQVGAKLIFSTGRMQEAGSIVFHDGSAMNYGREDNPDKPEYNYFKDVDYSSGAAICIRRSLWEELGGFDTRYAPAYYEDTDLAMRIRSKGYRTVYQPRSVVIHFEGVSHGTDVTVGIKKKQEENRLLFYERWKDELLKNNFLRDENIFRSRERSKHKPVVLLFGEGLSVSSGNSAGYRWYQAVAALAGNGFQVKCIQGGFLRVEPAVSTLEQMGAEVLYGTWYADNWQQWIRDHSANIDLVLYIDRRAEADFRAIAETLVAQGTPAVTLGKDFLKAIAELPRNIR